MFYEHCVFSTAFRDSRRCCIYIYTLYTYIPYSVRHHSMRGDDPISHLKRNVGLKKIRVHVRCGAVSACMHIRLISGSLALFPVNIRLICRCAFTFLGGPCNTKYIRNMSYR